MPKLENVICPYCGNEEPIDHNDYNKLCMSENEWLTFQCEECDKNFKARAIVTRKYIVDMID